jgi:hypothetical protein
MGDIAQAQKVLDELIATEDLFFLEIASKLSAWMGQTDLAFELLNTLTDRLGRDMARNVYNPMYRKLHSDPRWEVWRDSIGMSQARLDGIEFDIQLPR